MSQATPGNRLDRPVGRTDHTLGPDRAPITLLEYGSYACPHCRAANERIAEVRRELGDRLRYVFRQRPLAGNDLARRAAELVERARRPEDFWRAHMLLMSRSEVLTEDDLAAVARERINVFPGSPTIFSALMAHPAFAQTDWRSVHTCYSGSAALAEATMARWCAAVGAPVYEGYGLTEAGPVLSFNPAGRPAKPGSVGVAAPLTEIEIVDAVDGTRVLGAGERGEIRARGPQIMRGYRNRPEETAQALRDGWLYTGDIGEIDAEGCLYVRDRKKDMVIVGGYNVYPREVEEVLFAHPDVADAAVVGESDAFHGERLVAHVVLRPGAQADADALVAHCRARLAKYKLPARVCFAGALPKTSANKTDKLALRKLAPPPAST